MDGHGHAELICSSQFASLPPSLIQEKCSCGRTPARAKFVKVYSAREHQKAFQWKIDICVDCTGHAIFDAGVHKEDTAAARREISSLLTRDFATAPSGIQQKYRDSHARAKSISRETVEQADATPAH